MARTRHRRAAFEALSVEAATIVPQPSAWQRVRRNLSVRIGGIACWCCWC